MGALAWISEKIEVGSPEYWLLRLESALLERRDELERFDEYYRGEHPLVFASEKFQSAFGDLFADFSDNWCDLVVDATEERLNPTGFRFAPADDKKQTEADRDAWDIWQRNKLDAGSQLVHIEALINRESSVLVWYDDKDRADITIEHPTQMIVAPRRQAALKIWTEEDGYERANVYMPDGIYKYRSRTRSRSWESGLFIVGDPGHRWAEYEPPDDEAWPVPNPLGRLTVVPFYNRPRMLHAGVSELQKVIPLQDAVNKTISDMLLASEYGAYRQRWATGISIPMDPETGKAIEPFKSAVDRLWISKSKDTTFGEFSQTDLRNFVEATEMLVQHIASQTRTPPHYFYLKGSFPSGESIKSAETGLVAKVKRKQVPFGESWEEVLRLAFLIEGDTARGTFMGAETIWGDPESRSEAELADALTKMKALGVPNEFLWERYGFSSQEIQRMKAMKAAEPPAPAVPPSDPDDE